MPIFFAAVLSALAVVHAPGETLAADHNDPIGVQAAYRSGDSGGYDVATGDPAADVADLFAWYTGPQHAPKSVVLALTWRADPTEATEKAFDPSVKYGIHVDTDDRPTLNMQLDPLDPENLILAGAAHTKAEYDIIGWFGESKTQKGSWGVRVSGLPGVSEPVIGPVGKVLEAKPGIKVATGLFDDPFFADLDGFFNAISVALGNKPGNNPSLPTDRFQPKDPRTQQITRPFGYPVGVDGFGKQNIHALVVELPVSAFGGKHKLNVWATTDRKQGLGKSSHDLRCSYDGATGIYSCKKKASP